MTVQYPKWLYHATETARIVQDPGEQMELGAGWYDSPADVITDEQPVRQYVTGTPDPAAVAVAFAPAKKKTKKTR
jgi:hypothetical protein